MAELIKLIGGRHHWAEDAASRGVLVPSPDYEPIGSQRAGIRKCVAYVHATDDERLFERVTRTNGVVEWYEVLP